MALVAIMGISSIAIISCNDEDESRMDKQTTTVVQKAAPQQYELGLFIYKSPNEMECDYDQRGNCLPVVTIVATRLPLINNLCRSIDANVPIPYIERNRTELAEYFNSDDLDGVINGTLNLSYNVTDKTFIIFTNNRTREVIKVYPFSIDE